MTDRELLELAAKAEKFFRSAIPGTLIRNRFTGIVYLVTNNYGDRVTAVKTADATNASEWEIIDTPQYHEI